MIASAYRSSKNDHLPSLSEVYSYVQEEEDCHHAMLSLAPPLSTEKSVFIFSAWRGGRRASCGQWGGGRGGFSGDGRDKLKCEHCGYF